MAKQVFTHRTPGFYILTGFLLFWGCCWLLIVLGLHPTINDRPVTHQEAAPPFPLFALVGVFVLKAGLASALYTLNCRIEIEEGHIGWFDWLSRLKVRGSLETAEVSSRPSWAGWQSRVVQTDGGTVKFNAGISDCGKLLLLVRERTEDVEDAVRRMAAPTYVPATIDVSFRWTATHLFSVFWLVLVSLWTIGVLVIAGVVPMLLASIPFFAVGLWLFSKSWNERIRIGPDGLLWINWLGRTSIDVPLGRIIDMEAINGGEGGRTICIHTADGTVSFQDTGRNRKLLDEVLKVIDSRKAGEAAASMPKRVGNVE